MSEVLVIGLIILLLLAAGVIAVGHSTDRAPLWVAVLLVVVALLLLVRVVVVPRLGQ